MGACTLLAAPDSSPMDHGLQYPHAIIVAESLCFEELVGHIHLTELYRDILCCDWDMSCLESPIPLSCPQFRFLSFYSSLICPAGQPAISVPSSPLKKVTYTFSSWILSFCKYVFQEYRYCWGKEEVKQGGDAGSGKGAHAWPAVRMCRGGAQWTVAKSAAAAGCSSEAAGHCPFPGQLAEFLESQILRSKR